MPLAQPTYRPRDAEHTVLHAVVRDHLDGFLREASAQGGGDGLPEFVVREFREFLTCGVLAGGFARFRCEGCALERFLPFSCKGRGFCPSCGGRRMTERAAHLIDEILPWVPERLCRYLLRPLLAQERLRQRTDGRVLLELRKAWRDGTSHLLFEPMEFLEKLAALTPRPEVHLLLYHGILAPHARWRRQIVGFAGPSGSEGAAA